ncbi:MAG: hypothetical protein Q9214_001193 [Letrouitia sp. 1 TL-2023]
MLPASPTSSTPEMRSKIPQKSMSPVTRAQPFRRVKAIPSIEVQIPEPSSLNGRLLASGASSSVSTSSLDTTEYTPSDPLSPSLSASLGASSASYSPTISSPSGVSLQSSSKRLKQVVTNPSLVNLKVRDSFGRFAKPSGYLAKAQHLESTSTPQPTLSTYVDHNDSDIFIFKDRDHCCNDLIEDYERRIQEKNEEILSMVKTQTKEEDKLRLAVTKMLERKSREPKVKREPGEPDNGHKMTAPKLLQQFERMHVEDGSSDLPLEIHEGDKQDCGKNEWKKRKRVLDAVETSKDDQQVNHEKRPKKGVIEGYSSLTDDDMTGLDKNLEWEKRKKRKERKRKWSEARGRNSILHGKVSNGGNSRTFEKANTKECEKAIKDQDNLDMENCQHHRNQRKPTSKPERAEKQGSKSKKRMIEDNEQVSGNSYSQRSCISTHHNQHTLSTSNLELQSSKTPMSGKRKGSDIPPKVAPQSNRPLQLSFKMKTPCSDSSSKIVPGSQVGKKHNEKPIEPSKILNVHDSDQELSSPISNGIRCNSYIDLESFLPDTFAGEDEDGSMQVTSSHQSESSTPKPRQGAYNMGRSHTVLPRMFNVESHSRARSARNPATGANTIPLPTSKSFLFTAATTHRIHGSCDDHRWSAGLE